MPFCWQVSDHPPSPGGWVPVPGTVTKNLVAQSGSGSKYSALAPALVSTYYLDPSNLAKYCISRSASWGETNLIHAQNGIKNYQYIHSLC